MTKISEPPHAGYGLHDWILKSTRILSASKSADEVYKIILAKAKGSGREESILDREIRDAIDGALIWYDDNPEIRNKVAGGLWKSKHRVPREQWLAERMAQANRRMGYRRSPTLDKVKCSVSPKLVAQALKARIPALTPVTFFNLRHFYAGLNYPICLARDIRYAEVRPISYWDENHRYTGYQFISPNPFLHCGVGKGLKTNANAGERLWLIAEFDQGSPEEQLHKLFWINNFLALAMIVFSGGKSLHGWFCVAGEKEEYIGDYFGTMTAVGADPRMWYSIQYARMPGGWNIDRSRNQDIIHWNEDVVEDARGAIKDNQV